VACCGSLSILAQAALSKTLMKLTDQYFFFIHLAALDQTLTGKHVQVYLTLLSLWKLEGLANPFGLDKKFLPLLVKEKRRSTLNDALSDLDRKGFIKYTKPISRYHKAEVEIMDITPTVSAFFPTLFPAPKSEEHVHTYENMKVHAHNNVNMEGEYVHIYENMKAHAHNNVNMKEGYAHIYENMKRYVHNNVNMNVTNKTGLLTDIQSNESKNDTAKSSLEPDESTNKGTYIYSISNNINNKNSIASNACARETATKKNDQDTTQHQSKKSRKPKFIPPTEEEVSFYIAAFCKDQLQKTNEDKWRLGSSVFEQQAAKFFNHYEAIGWVVGKNKPMRSWQASARNWMLNYHDFNPEKKTTLPDNYLDVNEDKDYDIPL
jgi:hypothetical protein